MCATRSLWRLWVAGAWATQMERGEENGKRTEKKNNRSERWLTVSVWLCLCCFYSFSTLLHVFFFLSLLLLFTGARTSPTLLFVRFYVSDYGLFDYVCARVARYFSASTSRNKYVFPHVLLFARQYSCHGRCVYDLYKICAIAGYSSIDVGMARKKRRNITPTPVVHSIRYIFFGLFFAYTTAMLGAVGLHNQSMGRMWKWRENRKTTKLR